MNEERIQWLKDRRTGIGGSDVAAILGMSKWKGPMDVYLSKLEEGEPDDTFPNDYAAWGTILEAPIAQWFASLHPEFAVEKPETAICRHQTLGFLIASPDRFVFDHAKQRVALLEIKTASFSQLKSYQDGKIPEAYSLQIQHTMNVCGISKAWLAVLVGGQHYFEFPMDKDSMLCAEVEGRMAEFWKMVENRTPPVLDGTVSCTRALEKIYDHPSKTAIVVDESGEAAKWIEKYKAADQRVKDAELSKIEAGNHLREIIGNNVGVDADKGGYASWKSQVRKGMDNALFKKENPDLVKKYETSTTIRVLRVVTKEEETNDPK